MFAFTAWCDILLVDKTVTKPRNSTDLRRCETIFLKFQYYPLFHRSQFPHNIMPMQLTNHYTTATRLERMQQFFGLPCYGLTPNYTPPIALNQVKYRLICKCDILKPSKCPCQPFKFGFISRDQMLLLKEV